MWRALQAHHFNRIVSDLYLCARMLRWPPCFASNFTIASKETFVWHRGLSDITFSRTNLISLCQAMNRNQIYISPRNKPQIILKKFPFFASLQAVSRALNFNFTNAFCIIIWFDFLHNSRKREKKIKSSMSLRLQLDLMMKINENVKEKFFELGRPKWQGRRRCLNIDAVLHCTTMIHECYANALKWKQFCTCRTAMARTSLQEQPKTTRANSQLHLVFTVTLCCKYKNA